MFTHTHTFIGWFYAGDRWNFPIHKTPKTNEFAQQNALSDGKPSERVRVEVFVRASFVNHARNFV